MPPATVWSGRNCRRERTSKTMTMQVPLAARLLRVGALLTTLAAVTLSGCAPAGIPALTPNATARPPATTPASRAVLPAPTSAGNFLRTEGTRIVDAAGQEVRLTGVNWFGFETGTYAPHGLWSRNWEDVLDQIASLGFNLIRLPYSNQMFDKLAVPQGVDPKLNPDLDGLTPIQIMDKIVEGAGKRGIKILLDRHRPDAESQSELWYTDDVSEEVFVADWVMLARRYRGNDTIIGADLHNEPHGKATWGTGDPKTDWKLAVEKAGNAILEVNPDWLIVVEGIEKYNDGLFWWGGNLKGAAKHPIQLTVPNRLVYSPHDYGPSVWKQSWFTDPSFPQNMPKIWDDHWGFILKNGTAPLLLGELGGPSLGQDTDGTWQRALLDYVKERNISWAYWALNPDSADTDGILEKDWKSVNAKKLAYLKPFMAPMMTVKNPSAIDRSAQPMARPKPIQPIKLNAKAPREEKTANVPIHLQIANTTGNPLPLADLELRYWFDAGAVKALDQVVELDWTGISGKLVKTEIAEDARDGQTHVLKVSFLPDAGAVPAKSTLDLVMRVHQKNWGQYDLSKAWSHRPSDDLKTWERVALYRKGQRIWGQEPRGSESAASESASAREAPTAESGKK
ncbi:MAG: cellulase family glycosylhydrolase [Chloroflexi bacterium]|nr:cellulase family glycosylhydrolase [Chloroflexota bacterium]